MSADLSPDVVVYPVGRKINHILRQHIRAVDCIFNGFILRLIRLCIVEIGHTSELVFCVDYSLQAVGIVIRSHTIQNHFCHSLLAFQALPRASTQTTRARSCFSSRVSWISEYRVSPLSGSGSLYRNGSSGIALLS